MQFKPKLFRGQLNPYCAVQTQVVKCRDSTLKDVRIWGKMTGTGRKRQDETLALREHDRKKGGRGPKTSDTSRCLERQSEGTREDHTMPWAVRFSWPALSEAGAFLLFLEPSPASKEARSAGLTSVLGFYSPVEEWILCQKLRTIVSFPGCLTVDHPVI